MVRSCTLAKLAGVAAAIVVSAVNAPVFASDFADQLSSLPDQLSWAETAPHWSNSEHLKLKYFSSLIIANKLDHLEKAMDRYPLRGKYALQRTLFFTAAILRRRGNKKESVRIYRDILAEQPQLDKVRAELAATLYEMEDDEAAKHHLNRLLSSNANSANSEVFKHLLDLIDGRRPWQFGAYVTLAPSTNYNNGSRHKTIPFGAFELDIDNQEESGLGLRGGGYGSYTFRLKNDFSVITAGSVAHSEYPGDEFDDTQVSGNIELRKSKGPAYYGAGLVASRRLLGGEGESYSLGPRFTVKQSLAPQIMFRATFDYQEKRYDDTSYLNGRVFDTSFRTTIGLGADQALSILNGISHTMTRLRHNDNWTGYAGFGYYKEWPFGITTYSEALFHHMYYDGTYPLRSAPRRDQRFDFVTSLTKRDWSYMGFAPKIEYSMSYGISNVEFYEFTSHEVNLTATQSF